MSWTTPADLRAQVQRWWDRGELLRDVVEPTLEWPLPLTLKAPSAGDLSDRFDRVRDWAAALADVPHVRIERRDRAHRVQGRQQLPSAAWVDSRDAALALVPGGRRGAARFQALWTRTLGAQPALAAWLLRRPLQALDLEDRWDRLLAVVAWLQTRPRPDVYLRQVDAAGVDSKFIEAHRALLAEWLDLVLPVDAIEASAVGASQFVRRYGFRDKPLRVRFRLLDAAIPSLPGCRGLADITLDLASFAELVLPVADVIVTENETNFLALPPVPRAIAIFGAGYGWEPLSRATWLQRCRLLYWGDIDTHGFAILDRLRAYFPAATSLLMDRATLDAHRSLWGTEHDPVRGELPRLTAAEAVLYDDLRFDRIAASLRLEQERIGPRWMERAIEAAMGPAVETAAPR